MMKKIMLSIFKYLGIFLLVIGIFNLCLYLACLIPSSSLEENVRESADILGEQGMDYLISKIFRIVNNNCTDSVIINESYSIDNEHPYISYMKARKNYQKDVTINEIEDIPGEGVTVNYLYEDEAEGIEEGEVVGYYYDPIGELFDFLSGLLTSSLNYARYWHGYLILYRPLLLLWNITQIRVFLLILFIALFGYLMYLLYKRFGKSITFLFGLTLICSGYFSASYSLESSPIFLTMIISAIILVKRIDKIKDFSLYLFVVGCIANFVDYLTVPAITLGVLCGIYLLKLIEEGKDWKACVRFVIFNTIVWIAGYACTWLTKWILYDVTINYAESIISIGLNQSFYRMERNNEFAYGETHYINTILRLLGNSSFYTVLSVWGLMAINHFQIKVEKFDLKVIPFLLLSIIPVGWYVALANHTMMHAYFTYRHVLVYMLGMLLAFHQLFFGEKKK